MVMMITHASHLDNNELTAELTRLARCEREATAALIVHLAEFDARRLFEGAGYPSLFKYCMSVLLLCEDAVYNRITAARAARRYPAIIEKLESGALSPTTVRLLARHLTDQNHQELLAAASGQGKQAVEALVARRFPQPDVAGRVRKVPSRLPAAVADVPPTCPTAPNTWPGLALAVADAEAPLVLSVPAAAPARVRPLAPERYEIRFTASGEMREKLRVAQDLLGHAIPSGDIAQVFDRALTLLVAELSRKKFAATERPRPSRGQSDDSRNIPAEVRRAVSARDRGRCAFASCDGRRCNARRFLEFHHVVPYAAGGKPTVDNIQLRCRAHNGYEVERFYGPGKRRTRSDFVREGRRIYGAQERAGSSSWNDLSSTPPSSTSRVRVTRLRADGGQPR
jgi:hypothetical protein